MAKGRRFNPPLDEDGRWFPHVGLMQKTPESITRATLKEPLCAQAARQVEGRLPPIYKVREKGLGRKKISPDKRQHVSRNFNLWASDYVPSCLDGFSNNQISYVYKEARVDPRFRRFPRCYAEVWSTCRFIPEHSYPKVLRKKPKELMPEWPAPRTTVSTHLLTDGPASLAEERLCSQQREQLCSWSTLHAAVL
ncbi:testis-expressed protein 36 isoform X3 [Oryctolagus cuniculus]|uniref:testis-expressed protein 36 isoform X3 n=1 Tax=Oryctolagus cuniculus TaxID=9986 RepID=UPI0038791606